MGSASRSRRKSSKAFWFALHGWLTIPIWGLLLLISITGTVCVVAQEITWLISPQVRAENPHNSATVPFDVMAGAVSDRYPGAKIQSMQISAPYFTYLVRAGLPDGGRKVLYVNQYTGQIKGEMRSTGFRGFMLALHGWLLFPWQNNYSVGWYVVTAVSLPLMGAMVSGLVLVKRFWRLFYRPRLRMNKGARVFWGDAHRLLGGWSVWFILIISASGFWFLVQGVLDQNHVSTYPQAPELARSAVPVTASGGPPALTSLDGAVARARMVYPDLRVRYIELPEHAYATLTVRGTRGFSLLRENATAVHFNPYSGEPVAVRSASDLTAVQFASALLVPLHFGDFGGIWSKLIWFLFGCLLSLMICSGLIIWTKRTASTTRTLGRGDRYTARLEASNGDLQPDTLLRPDR